MESGSESAVAEDSSGVEFSSGAEVVVTDDREILKKAGIYFFVILLFALGAGLGSVLTSLWGHETIWVSCALLLVSFLLMFAAEKQ